MMHSLASGSWSGSWCLVPVSLCLSLSVSRVRESLCLSVSPGEAVIHCERRLCVSPLWAAVIGLCLYVCLSRRFVRALCLYVCLSTRFVRALCLYVRLSTRFVRPLCVAEMCLCLCFVSSRACPYTRTRTHTHKNTHTHTLTHTHTHTHYSYYICMYTYIHIYIKCANSRYIVGASSHTVTVLGPRQLY
jgi:hypothetical protein